jgi:hypothetical protein
LKNMRTAQLLSNVGDPQDGGPVRADDRADIAADELLSTFDRKTLARG